MYRTSNKFLCLCLLFQIMLIGKQLPTISQSSNLVMGRSIELMTRHTDYGHSDSALAGLDEHQNYIVKLYTQPNQQYPEHFVFDPVELALKPIDINQNDLTISNQYDNDNNPNYDTVLSE